MPEKVTTMVLKVDLECHRCYKKVKKVLSKFPQTEIDFVNEQEVQDQTYDEKQNMVTIKVVCCCPEKIMQQICCKGGRSITSIEIKVPEEPKEEPKDKPKEPEKKEEEPSKEAEKPKADAPPPPEPLKAYPIPMAMGTCCGPCSLGYGGGPCFHAQGGPPPPCYGIPVYGSYGGGYFSEDNPSGCTIM